jgi:hypothetical protein
MRAAPRGALNGRHDMVVFEPNDEPLRVKLPLKPAELVIVTIAQLVAASE